MPGVSVMELSLGAWCEYHGAVTGCLVCVMELSLGVWCVCHGAVTGCLV